MATIIERIEAAIAYLNDVTYPDGLKCHCGPDAGAVPCELCGERDLLRDAKREIDRLRGIVDKLLKCWRLDDAGKLVQDVSMVLGMVVWARWHGIIFRWRIYRMDRDGWCWARRCEPSDGSSSPEMGTKCFYATREATEAAKTDGS